MPLAILPSRNIVAQATELPPVKESDLDRVLKMIPTEVLTFYTAAVPMTAGVAWKYLPFALFLFGLVLVPLVLYADGKNTHVPAKLPQYIVRCLAFVAWANAISWPFEPWTTSDLNWLRGLLVLLVPVIGSVLLKNQDPAP